MIEHDERCADCACRRCRAFSTDGTRLGQVIAHTMGTNDENEIIENARRELRAEVEANLTGMPAEQADWEEGSSDDED